MYWLNNFYTFYVYFIWTHIDQEQFVVVCICFKLKNNCFTDFTKQKYYEDYDNGKILFLTVIVCEKLVHITHHQLFSVNVCLFVIAHVLANVRESQKHTINWFETWLIVRLLYISTYIHHWLCIPWMIVQWIHHYSLKLYYVFLRCLVVRYLNVKIKKATQKP